MREKEEDEEEEEEENKPLGLQSKIPSHLKRKKNLDWHQTYQQLRAKQDKDGTMFSRKVRTV